MIRKWSKTINWIMIVALFMTVLPAGIASAADTPTIRYFTFANFSESKTAPQQVTTSTVDLVGEFNGVSTDSISYKIDLITLKKVADNGDDSDYEDVVLSTRNGTDVKPIIESGKKFRFPSIKLDPGLNRVTVSGVNAVGNTVKASAYVRFSSAPIVYDIKSADGRVLSDDAAKPTVVDSKSVMLKAENVDEIIVMGKKMFSGDGKTYVASELPLKAGVNTLTFVASNGSMKQTLTRSVIYYTGSPMPFNIVSSDGQKIENDAVVGNPSAIFSGSVVYKYEAGKAERFADIKMKLTRPFAPGEPTDPADPDYPTDLSEEITVSMEDPPSTPVVKDSRFITFPFDMASFSTPIDLDGTYTLQITGGDYGTQKINKTITFKNQSAGGSFISDVQIAQNVIVNEADKTIKYDSTTPLAAGTTFMQPKFYLIVTTSTDDESVGLKSFQYGSEVGLPAFQIDDTYTIENGPANKKVIRVDAMPIGLQNFVFSTSVNEAEPIPVSYVASSYIDITNVQNGKVFSKPTDLEKVEFKLVNFTVDDLNSNPIKVMFNGEEISLGVVDVDDINEFEINYATHPMKPGSNTLTISGVAGGVPVSTTLTFYLFSKFTPEIRTAFPVPYNEIDRPTSDVNGVFRPAGPRKFTTYERNLDVIFIVRNVDSIDISIDGNSFFSGPIDGIAEGDAKVALIERVRAVDESGEIVDDNGDPVYDYKFRIKKQLGETDPTVDPLILPKSGTKNISITGHKGISTVSQTLEIVRELPPFLILSPKLPQEKVVSSNFLNVSIEAEGADQVLIGKTELTKDAKRDIFRTNVPLTKAGNNTIKFTVMQGKQKINGQFVVNYSSEKTQGAQYKTQLPASGKLTAFKGDITITLPKGTMLQEANPTPGQVSPSIDLYDKQDILFGIADRKDGRTLKRYNAVGEEDASGNALDGELKTINADESAIQILTLPSRFGYASNLYWIDAGYMKRDLSGNDAELVSGQLPYKATNDPVDSPKFYERPLNKWLEPTQRGKITMKYDPTILNASSNKLSIWRWVDNDKRWVNLGGTIDTKKKTVTAPFEGFGYYAVLNVRYSFDDVIGHKYARNSLELMMSKNIMKPKDNNEFGVYDNITRGEFATMLVKILDIPLEYDAQNPTFDDVRDFGSDNTLWDFRYVETAVRKGIIRGIAPRVFSPNGNLTREEGTTMIARALDLKQGTPEKDLAKLQKTFTDANTIDYYAVGAVLAVSKAGYITGIQNTIQDGAKKAKATFRFDPKSGLTRADAAVIAERIMKKLKKI